MKRPDYPFRAFEFDNYWVCEFPDLSGCIGTGETQLEAVKDALEASELWLAVYYEDNGKYPPVSDVYANTYSGNFSVRTSPTMHRNLVIRAAEEKVSMNCARGTSERSIYWTSSQKLKEENNATD